METVASGGGVSKYHEQLRAHEEDIDLGFWREPVGVEIPNDGLRALLVPDQVQSRLMLEVARQVHDYQLENLGTDRAVTKAVQVTMGGLLPGVLLHDHLAHLEHVFGNSIDFGTIGTHGYDDVGVALEEPIIVQDVSVNVRGEQVLAVEDLIDRGGTASLVAEYMRQHGVKGLLMAAAFLKQDSYDIEGIDHVFSFAQVPKDTWIITPRERVEYMVKRVPVWLDRGADGDECVVNLEGLIGYPGYLVEYYLPMLVEGWTPGVQ